MVKVIDIELTRNMRSNGSGAVSASRLATTAARRRSSLYVVPAGAKTDPLMSSAGMLRPRYLRTLHSYPRLVGGAYVGLTMGAVALACWGSL